MWIILRFPYEVLDAIILNVLNALINRSNKIYKYANESSYAIILFCKIKSVRAIILSGQRWIKMKQIY